MDLRKKESDLNAFVMRHVGVNEDHQKKMLQFLGLQSTQELMERVIPKNILQHGTIHIPEAESEAKLIERARLLSKQNKIQRTFLGMGYSPTVTPSVIQRNILENPGWYTQYTPYQAEISQGRLEALLNFQTMIADLTGLPIANASLLDEGTAAAEAMTLSFAIHQDSSKRVYLLDERLHPQTIAVIKTRAQALGLEVAIVDFKKNPSQTPGAFGAIIAYPGTHGDLGQPGQWVKEAKGAGLCVTLCCDLLSLLLFSSPGEIGADIAVGSTQRFGVPLFFGGPHAAFFATRDEHKRRIPGRIIGVSVDKHGKPAMRLSLQTREQHIRREKATSNICTAQVLLAIMASMYAVYHGPNGLRQIARRVHHLARSFALGAQKLGYKVVHTEFFDTVMLSCESTQRVDKLKETAKLFQIEFRSDPNSKFVSFAFDETKGIEDVVDCLRILNDGKEINADPTITPDQREFLAGSYRSDVGLKHEVFNRYHTETEMLRYIRKLEGRDLSLTRSMIPLGSCTMKLNATAELFPVSFKGFSAIHPFTDRENARGYHTLIGELECFLAGLTGFDAISLQPNAGSQGEFAGLLAILGYHRSQNQSGRNLCLIPKSAHGTNPASAVMAGMQVVVVECDSNGNIDVADLEKKAKESGNRLAALMVTYPSTHGVFEESIVEICKIIHQYGGQVYMDGANFNAQVGYCRPADYGVDVCHLNLHKTFAIPHGGGGPGIGPIGVKKHLKPFLPGHPDRAVSSAPWGSAGILPISWAYIRMLGLQGMQRATEVAILNANYIAKRLDPHFPVLYKSQAGWVAHECIVDLRTWKAAAGIDVEDVAKRLMDYGFHAPTVSFPVIGTLMIEPTESESKAELDRFCDAMISIASEIKEIADGKMDRTNNPLKNAPHTMFEVAASNWDHPYSREKAAFPLEWVKDNKFWPHVSRVDSAAGDKNLICTCPDVSSYA